MGETTTGVGRKRTVVAGRTVEERLLDAAAELFAERGFESTTTRDIVEAAGVTKGAMYHYFSSKDDLLYEIYARVLRLQMERLETLASADGPVEERLHAAAADVVVTTIHNITDTATFFRSLHQIKDERFAGLRRERRRYFETFAGLIEAGQEAGVFRRELDPALVVDYYLGAVHHVPRWYSPTGPRSPEEIGLSFADLFLRSLAA